MAYLKHASLMILLLVFGAVYMLILFWRQRDDFYYHSKTVLTTLLFTSLSIFIKIYDIYTRKQTKKIINSSVMGLFAASEQMLLTYFSLFKKDENCFDFFNRSNIFQYSFYCIR